MLVSTPKGILHCTTTHYIIILGLLKVFIMAKNIILPVRDDHIVLGNMSLLGGKIDLERGELI